MPTSLLNLLQTPTSYVYSVPKWNGGPVPPTFQPNVNPNPPGSRHDEYSINGNPAIQVVAAGFSPFIPQPSKLEEGDSLNTAAYRNAPGLKYLDQPHP
jgi:hypothetical protein